MSPLDTGNTWDPYTKRPTQSSLRVNQDTKGLYNLVKPMLAIILKVHPSDSSYNHNSGFYSDRRSFVATCDVLITEDGKGSYFRKNGVIIPPTHPTGLDDYVEQLPRGCSTYVNGEAFDASLSSADIKDLDGDWAIISFVGGYEQQAYVSNWWPHPRNTLDPQTCGEGATDSDGVPHTLVQQQLGNGRYFRRINGVEYVVNGRGDIFLSTHYAGGTLTPNPDGSSTYGRFSREVQPGSGGGIRVNVKPSQPLELSWSDQIDGIGLNNAYDPSLPQTNPPQVRDIAATKTGTYVRITGNAVSFEPPTGFSVKTSDIRLDAGADLVIMVGSRLVVNSSDTIELSVANNYTLDSQFGDVSILSRQGDIVLEVQTGNITLTVNDPSTQKVFLGSETNAVPILRGLDVTAACTSFADSIIVFAGDMATQDITLLPIMSALANAANTWKSSMVAALSTVTHTA